MFPGLVRFEGLGANCGAGSAGRRGVGITSRALTSGFTPQRTSTMSKKDQQPDDVADDAHGVIESQQDRKHDDAAKQRPGQEDLKVHDAHSRRPTGKAGQGE